MERLEGGRGRTQCKIDLPLLYTVDETDTHIPLARYTYLLPIASA